MSCTKRMLIAGLPALGLAACGEQNSGNQASSPAAQPSSTPGQTQSTQYHRSERAPEPVVAGRPPAVRFAVTQALCGRANGITG